MTKKEVDSLIPQPLFPAVVAGVEEAVVVVVKSPPTQPK